LVNVLILNSKYVNAFNQIMMLNPCSVLFVLKIISQTECENFADSSVSQVAFVVNHYYNYDREWQSH